MNYHELVQEVTLPLNTYVNGYIDPKRGAEEDNREDAFVEILSPSRTWAACVEGHKRKETATLIKHCVNNFDKALKALKSEHEQVCVVREALSDQEREWARLCPICSLIAQLETVEDV